MTYATLVPAEEWTLGPDLGADLGAGTSLDFGSGIGNLSTDFKVSPPSLKVQTRWHRSSLPSVYCERLVQLRLPISAGLYASTYLQAMCCPPQDNNSLQGRAGKPGEIQHFPVGSGFLLGRD